MRLSGDWMVLADDRILKYIRKHGSGTPKEMEDSGYVRYSRQDSSQRCKELVDHEFLQHLGNCVYIITDDGSADRSEAEYSFAGLLIGIFTYTGGGPRALELTSAYITHACRENQTTADGQIRKWLERYSGDYPRRTLREAYATFDFDIWSRDSGKESTDAHEAMSTAM